ncbi:MAG: hypothetical protein M1814_003516 [Vezdaea aestivalis]|nr:MAG: hypothetical protein M1814_003516 [Vezdaea aestivalis]
MDDSRPAPTQGRRPRRASSRGVGNASYVPFYRRDSNASNASFVSNVEMAQEEVFAGPMSESVPSSITSFAHRRNRANSTASFTYFEGGEGGGQIYGAENAIEDDDDLDFDPFDVDLEHGAQSPLRRKSSAFSEVSAEDPLLKRRGSNLTNTSNYGGSGPSSQKIYIASEDLTMVIAGFKTSRIGFTIYITLSVLTLGLGYLLLHWLPRWRVRLVGRIAPLAECSWVAIENQWGEFIAQDIAKVFFDRPLSSVFTSSKFSNGIREDYEEDQNLRWLRFVDYRYIRFCFHPRKQRFVLIGGWQDPAWTEVQDLRSGLESDECESRQGIFGSNLLDVQEKSIFQLAIDEVFHPFYVFQIASIVLWTLDDYYYYATCIFFISAISVTTTLVETKATMKRLHEISLFECDVRVLRNGFWRYVSSSDLVPGDIYEVTDPSLSQFPSDGLLLSGDCIVNESMLTGESVPVSKVPASNESLELLNLGSSSVHPELSKNFLFCGTKIIRARRPQDDKDDEAVALGLVLRTGFNTTKGALVRSMLFPKPSGFKFYRDSFRYISVMGLIALVGFTTSFMNFVRLKLAWHLIIVRALDLITIVVPPALPATLTIGTNFALSRLKKKQIFCISPQRVNVGGKLDVVCFDKTGTLTEDGLDILGVRVVENPTKRFSDLLTDSSSLLPTASYERDPTVDYALHKDILYTMATCHSLKVVEEEFVGDPLDLKMFKFTEWSFKEGQQKAVNSEEEEQIGLSPSIARPPPGMEYEVDQSSTEGENNGPLELGVLKIFEFISQLRRSSVLVRRFGTSSVDVYVKGAPESMKSICKADSFPPDYEDLLNYYTHRGYRVIACASKHLPKISWVKSQKLTRKEAESELNFVGFIIFENKLKPATEGVIRELSQAGIRQIMCTGDNILTAISVARECGLIESNAHCFIPHFIEGDFEDPKARLAWESVDNSIFQLDDQTLIPLPPPSDGDASLPYDITNLRNYSVAITGDVFRWIVDFAPQEILHRLLVCGQIFARMSPDGKHELVEKLQSIDHCCCFCGDGANDCGALKAADVGISLSEAEASVAAPFTSRVFDISCVSEVIREGRAALVTSFSCFKYMSLYSAIQFTTISFLYASASNLGDFQYLFIDLLLILPIAIFMGWTGAYPVLCKKRPTAKLVSRKVLTPLLGQIVICLTVQLVCYILVRGEPWYLPPKLRRNHSNIKNSENTTLFLLSCYQYILSGVVLSIGPPFRLSMLDNVPFVVTIVVTLLISLYMLFDPAQWLIKLMQLTDMSMGFRVQLLIIAVLGFVASWAGEKTVFPWLSKRLSRLNARLRPNYLKKRKTYKLLLEELRL